MYKRLAEGGLTPEEEKHSRIFVRLLEKYPDAFDRYQDGKGRPILKSQETARGGAVNLWVTERGAVEFHSSSGMNLLSDESRNELRGQFETYLRDSFVNDIDAVVSGRIKGKDAGRWVSFPQESTLPLVMFRKVDLLDEDDNKVWKPVLSLSNDMNAAKKRVVSNTPSIAEKIAAL